MERNRIVFLEMIPAPEVQIISYVNYRKYPIECLTFANEYPDRKFKDHFGKKSETRTPSVRP